AKNVIHTVGPFIDKRGVSKIKEHLLASCYLACLRLADEHQLDTIVFCCISTGEINFTNQCAAEIAILIVTTYIKDTESKLHVIFNVFKEKDLNIYQSLLTEEKEIIMQQLTHYWKTPIKCQSISQPVSILNIIEEADAVVVGIGAGMWTAAGFTYVVYR